MAIPHSHQRMSNSSDHPAWPALAAQPVCAGMGQVAFRASGHVTVGAHEGLVQGVSRRYGTVVQCGDGYGYLPVANTDATGTPPKPVDDTTAAYRPGIGDSRTFV